MTNLDEKDNPYFMKFCEARYRECNKSMQFIETLLATRFDNVDKALALARDTSDQSKDSAKADLERHLELLNNSAKKMEKLEGTFATKDDVTKEFMLIKEGVTKEFRGINKIIYIMVGIVIAIEFIFKYLIK